MKSICPICGSDSASLITKIDYDLLHPLNKFAVSVNLDYFGCEYCIHYFITHNAAINLDHYYATSPGRGWTSGGLNSREGNVLSVVTQELHSLDVRNIFEVGGGISLLPKHLLSYFSDATYFALDPVLESQRDSHSFFTDPRFQVVTDLATIERSSIDLFLARQVLEHIPKPLNFLEDLVDKLKPNGYLYLEVPNFQYTVENQTWYDICFEHLHYFTVESFSTLINRVGLARIEMGFLNGGHDMYFLCRNQGVNEVHLRRELPPFNLVKPRTPVLPALYIAYGCNSNLESFLNLSGTSNAPLLIFDDGVDCNKVFFRNKPIIVSKYDRQVLDELNNKFQCKIEIIVFAPFAFNIIKNRIGDYPNVKSIFAIDQ